MANRLPPKCPSTIQKLVCLGQESLKWSWFWLEGGYVSLTTPCNSFKVVGVQTAHPKPAWSIMFYSVWAGRCFEPIWSHSLQMTAHRGCSVQCLQGVKKKVGLKWAYGPLMPVGRQKKQVWCFSPVFRELALSWMTSCGGFRDGSHLGSNLASQVCVWCVFGMSFPFLFFIF